MGGGCGKEKYKRTAADGDEASDPQTVSNAPSGIHNESVSPLRRMLPSLRDRGKASVSRKAEKFNEKKRHETQVVRIALTGGPCAGKSSVLEHIIKAGTQEGFDIYSAPEAATLIFNSGCTFPEDREKAYFFQQSLCRMQLELERSLISIAGNTGRPSVIIFDRGLMDVKGYMDDEGWQRLLQNLGAGSDGQKNGVDEQYLLTRYDAVIHLVTAADGAEKFYKWGKTTDDSGNTVIRGEPPEQARALDKKMQEVWKNHSNHIIIGNTDAGFKAKLEAAAAAVIKIAHVQHPEW